MTKFTYIRPDSLSQAISMLNDPTYTNRPLAGGTDLLVHLHQEEPDYTRLVDISKLPELKEISLNNNVITLGAGVTYSEAIESEILEEKVPFLVEACQSIGGPQIRNTGTIGGNIANAAPCADSLPVLVCLDAEARILGSQGERKLLVSQLVEGPNHTQIKPGELLTHFIFNTPPLGVKTAYIKLGRRNAQAISRMTVAVMGGVDADGRVDYIHITPGAITPQTMRFAEPESMMLHQIPTVELIANIGRKVAETMISITGRRWSTEYKEPVIAKLTERALTQVFLS